MATVGLMIKAALERADLSQHEAAGLAECSAKHLNQIINGHQSISVDLALRLQKALGAEPWFAQELLYAQVRAELEKRTVRTAG